MKDDPAGHRPNWDPYLDWRLDRWKLALLLVLFVLLLTWAMLYS